MDHPAANQSTDLILLDFLTREDINHTRHFLGLGSVDGFNGGMRMGAAHEISEGLVLQIDIVGVLALARNEPVVFLAQHACANACIAHGKTISLHFCCSGLNSRDNVMITGAAANIAR